MEKVKVKVKNGSRVEHVDRVDCSRKERKDDSRVVVENGGQCRRAGNG